MSYKSQYLDDRLEITESMIRLWRTQKERYGMKPREIAKRYPKVNILLASSILNYKVWPELLPYGYQQEKSK